MFKSDLWGTVTLTQAFIAAGIPVNAISCATTFSMFRSLIPFITHVSLELRENSEIALN